MNPDEYIQERKDRGAATRWLRELVVAKARIAELEQAIIDILEGGTPSLVGDAEDRARDLVYGTVDDDAEAFGGGKR